MTGDQRTVDFHIENYKAFVQLNRPDSLNAFTQQMQRELMEIWAHCKRSDDVRVIVLSARGRAFCSGVDNRESLQRRTAADAAPAADEPTISTRLTAKQNGLYKPVICAVNGLCAGGGFYFVGDADIVIASEAATFLEPHVTWGRTAAIEPILLSRRMPLGAVLRMALLGTTERMSAQRAYELGLVSEVVEADRLLERANELADQVLRGAPRALAGTVEAVWRSLDLGLSASIPMGFDVIQKTSGGEDTMEGLKAFAERREPRWSGR